MIPPEYTSTNLEPDEACQNILQKQELPNDIQAKIDKYR